MGIEAIGTFWKGIPRVFRIVSLGVLLATAACSGGGGGGGDGDGSGGGGAVNTAPLANAGADRTVDAGVSVSLSGASTTDAEGGTLRYAWSQVSGPAVSLQGAETIQASFTAPSVSGGTTLVFELAVTDPGSLTGTARVTIHVNAPPVLGPRALIDPVSSVAPNSFVVLDGSHSTDSAGGSLSYSWVQKSGTSVELTGASTSTLSFTAPAADGDLVFELTVTAAGDLADKAQVTVAVAANPTSPMPPASTLINQAVTTGTLTPQQGIVYKVFAVFGDPRLPLEYRGSGLAQTSGTAYLAELVRNYDTLSEDQKALVYPYLVPPYVTNSWYDLAYRQAQKVAPPGRAGRVATASPAAAHPWKWVRAGKVKVWYEDGYSVNYTDGSSATSAELAEGVLDAAAGTAWPKFQELMQTEPLPDGGVALPPAPGGNYGQIPGPLDGSDDLDIVLCLGMNASGYTIPYKADPTPAFITIKIDEWVLGSETTPGLIQIAAHEMMHAWQFSYEKKDTGAAYSYAWLQEATAAWAEDYVYPDANSENRYAAWYLDTMPVSVDDTTGFRQYGVYSAFSYWTYNSGGPDIVRQAWEATKTNSGIDAADAMNPLPLPEEILQLTPHRYKSFWERYFGDYLVSAWNRGTDGYFFHKDKLVPGAKTRSNTPVEVSGVTKDKVFFLDDLDVSKKIELPYLSGRYYHFVFNDETARTVMFYDGLRSKLDLVIDEDGTTVYAGVPVEVGQTDPLVDPAEGATWRLLAKIGGEWQEWVPEQGVNTTGMVPFCRDAKAERVEELVVILANSSATQDSVVKPAGEYAPLLLVTNLACLGWTGTFTYTRTPSSGPQETTTATVEWRRMQDIYPSQVPSATLGAFLIESAVFQSEVSGQSEDCTYKGSDSWSGDQKSLGSDGPDAVLGLAPQLRAGPMYRNYDGDGDAGGHISTYTATCPKADPPTSTIEYVAQWWKSRSGPEYPSVSADGTQISGTLDDGEDHYQWTLHSVRDP